MIARSTMGCSPAARRIGVKAVLVCTSTLDRNGIKNLCDRLQIMQRYRDIMIVQRSTALGILRQLERRKPGTRPRNSSLYRWFQPLSTDVLLMMMAKASKEPVRQWISRYITHLRSVQPLLTGHDLENLGFPAGPQFRVHPATNF